MPNDQKVVIITGASSGIGFRTANYLSSKGFYVFGASRSPVQNCAFEWIQMDVTNEESIKNAIDYIWKKKGRIDVVINNAGLGLVGPLEETTNQFVEKIFNTNVVGVISVARVVMPYLRLQQSGMIINISSIAAAMGLPYRGIYSASKAAVEIITEALSIEVKNQGIVVCSVLPGDIATSINQNRLVVPLAETSIYKKEFDRIQKQIKKEVSTADDPLMIAEAIGKIIESKRPKLHYKVGPLFQRITGALKIILPQRWFEYLLMRFYGIY